MTQELISEINKLCPYEQGIFVQPYGIPVLIKEPVAYYRYEIGGEHGGNCWGDSPTNYSNDTPQDRMMVLDLILERIKPNITYLQFKKIESLIHTNEETQHEYYGNSTDYKIEYIILSELEKYLSTI